MRWVKVVMIQGARCIDPLQGLDQIANLWVHPDGIEVNPEQVTYDPEVIDGTGLGRTGFD